MLAVRLSSSYWETLVQLTDLSLDGSVWLRAISSKILFSSAKVSDTATICKDGKPSSFARVVFND